MSGDARYTIGELSRQAGLGVDTVRYYLKRDLLPEPQRSASGYRRFDADALERLRFILQAKELGFTLSEISDLIALLEEPDVECSHVRQRALAKITSIDAKLAMLTSVRQRLASLAEQCPGAGPLEQCPILPQRR